MLKSELNKLENYISEIINKHKSLVDLTGQQQMTEQVKSVLEICNELKSKWTHELFSSVKEQVITRYVQYHQAGITQLSNQITGMIPVNDPRKSNSTGPEHFFGQILSELEELLSFLRHQLYHHFDLDYKTTSYSFRQQCAQIDDFRQKLASYSENEIEIPLVEVIGISVREMTDDALQRGISYRQTGHTLNMLRMTHQLIHGVQGTTTGILAHSLYRQNLNTKWFLNWYRDHIQRQVNNIQSNQDQTNFLRQQINALEGVFVDPEKAFEPELPSTDLVLLPWLYEISGDYDKTLRTLNKTDIPVRLALNLSVPQFALFIRVFSKVGCFADTNISKINRFFTQHFTTKKQSNVSRKSFGKAFYGLDQTTAAVVRDYLQKMINYINKTYFP